MSSYLIRIVNLDYCMCAPIQGLDVMYSEFRGASVNQVPILRLFGSTATGKKICVHVHGVFPYFYIPYDGIQEVNSLMYQIAANIDRAINISLNQASSNTQHVYKISLVSGIPMYGYHNKKHQFLKIHLYNPMLIRKVSNLLMNEVTLGKFYQPHETHLNFTLQFMIDYNLHGMSNLVLSGMKFRIDPSQANISDINPELILPATVQKVTVCELEGDAFAEHIVNQLEVASGNIAVNPGIDALWADEMQRRRNKGETSQIPHLLELKNTNIKPTMSHYMYKKALLERLAVLSTEKSGGNVLEKLNLSVYPAETPDNVNIQNTSLVNVHTPSDLESSLSDLTLSSTTDLEDTIITQSSDLNTTLDAEAQNLLEVLHNLGENTKEDREDDSILSQVVKEVDEDERELDLSMPLEAVTTPKKIISNKDGDSTDDELWDELNTTLIPQLDGEYDKDLEKSNENALCIHINQQKNYKNVKYNEKCKSNNLANTELKCIKKALYVKIVNINNRNGRNMPLLDEDLEYEETNNFYNPNDGDLYSTGDALIGVKDCDYLRKKEMLDSFSEITAEEKEDKSALIKARETMISNEKTAVKRKWVRKSAYVRTQEDIKKLENRIKKINRQNQLIRIMRKLHDKEHKLSVLLSKWSKPKFKVVSKHKVHPQYNKKSTKAERFTKVAIISDIILKTANYVDPSLHFTLQHPTGQCFLFNYNRKICPKILEIPKDVMKHEKTLKKFIDEKSKTDSSDNSYYSCSENSCSIDKETVLLREDQSLVKYDLDNLEKGEISTVLFEDLPEFLKNSITLFPDHLDDLYLEYYNNEYQGNLNKDDLENNNYFKEVFLDSRNEIPINLASTDPIEPSLNAEESHISVQIQNRNKVLEDFIDADNKNNLYIYSSKYLTNVNDDYLVNTIKSQSPKKLKETIETVRQQLQKHIQYLKTLDQQKRNKFSCSSKERSKMFDSIKCLETKECNRNDTKNNIYLKEIDNSIIQCKNDTTNSLLAKMGNRCKNNKRSKSNTENYPKKAKLNTKKLMENVGKKSTKKNNVVATHVLDRRYSTVLTENNECDLKVKEQPPNCNSSDRIGRYYLRSANQACAKGIKLENIEPNNDSLSSDTVANKMRRSSRISSPKYKLKFGEFNYKSYINLFKTDGVNKIKQGSKKLNPNSTVYPTGAAMQPKVECTKSSQKYIRRKNKPNLSISSSDTNNFNSTSDDDSFTLKCRRPPRTGTSVEPSRYPLHVPLSISSSSILKENINCPSNGESKVANETQRSSPKYKSKQFGAFDFKSNRSLVEPDGVNIKKQLAKKLNLKSSVNTSNQPKKSLQIYSEKISKPKLCISLDGTKDSSSSDDDETYRLERKRSLRSSTSVDSLRYSALPVSVVSSPRSCRDSKVSADNHLVSLNTIKNTEKKKTPVNLNRGQQAVCDINVKRKLNFNNISSLHGTIIEENKACNFSSATRTRSNIHISNNEIGGDIQEINCPEHVENIVLDEDVNFNISMNSRDHTDNELANESVAEMPCLQTVVNSSKVEMEKTSSCHCDIFSNSDSDNEINRSFFKSSHILDRLMLTTAEKYDKETNFNAKEGTSKAPQENLFHIESQISSGEIIYSSSGSSLGLLTPYQRIVEQHDLHLETVTEENEMKTIENSGENSEDIFSSGNSLKTADKISESLNCKEKCDALTIIVPVKKAPSRKDVIKSLDSHKIPRVKIDTPFYSNVEDVTGSVEVGYNVLKISSKTTAHLPEFESQSDSMNRFRKCMLDNLASNLEWKKSDLKKLKLSFCIDRDCIIVPVKKPPTVEMVKNWIKVKSRKVTTPIKKTEKIKIIIPQSPGNDNNDDDMSLTISPCTPKCSQSSQNTSVHQTPKSSTGIMSPVLGDKCREHKKKLKYELSSHSDASSLRKSLLVSQDSSHNQSHQITGVTVNNTYGFDKSTANLQEARAVIEHQHLTLLVMEMHIRTRGDFKPNPEYDSIRAIFYSVLNDVPENHPKAKKSEGIIAINSLPLSLGITKVPILDGAGIDCNIIYVDSEENLLNEFVKLMTYWDPDIIAGYEIEMLSWGYLIERANVLGMNIKPLLARTKDNNYRHKNVDGENELKIVGRIVLDVWRLMRHEVALQSYTFESIVYHILHRRVPNYSFKDLSFWWDHRSTLYRYRTVHYYLFRVTMILELFDKLDLIGRTSELARLFGIQFFEVLSRGSQFRVESMMLRLAKPLNFIPVSPSIQQRAKMKAPEYIALVLEPESKLYNDPVIVLDFQSLYPSIIIAYNYCFTTCVGRVENLGRNDPFEFGASQLKVSRRKLEKLLKKDLLNFSPCGVGFVKKKVRDGILPRMLREILDTRLMVKNSMKENKDEHILQKVLHNRQLGLKLIANVTYGYTAANFSGRMPSVEVGDSVVSKGRETLQRAIEMVDNTPEWGARVVYGDTDSLFVLVPGKTRECAFEVGKKIADAITEANRDPIKLKMEKVYQPCILQTKKRYVGYMYESPDQKEPVYDAKGIETVRRDGCPAVSKMLEKCLRLLFETKDISLIKKYVLRQFNKILAGRASIQDLTFAKEYRGAAGYRPGACVPSLELARRWTAVDKRNEPRSGERVPYIIVNGPPGLPLIRLVRSPRELLNDSSLRPNALYYIMRVIIPPINRCFNLIGADLNIWFNQMPRKQIHYLPSSVSPGKKSTISQYFSTTNCVACGEHTQTGICDKCSNMPQGTTIILTEKLRNWEMNYDHCNLICQTCTLSQHEIKCVSLDCPVLYRRIQTSRDVQQATYVRQLLFSSEFLF